MASFLDKVNGAVHNSAVGRFFEFESRNAKFTSELRGATATFFSMAYILAVNPRILADSGGPCDDSEGIFSDSYAACMEEIKREYVTSTAIASMLGCLLMGIFANLPIALAPGMGMNAYFTYSVVGWRGTGSIDFDSAITAVMIEGVIFFVLAATGIRHAITKLLPEPVRVATPAAIGFFLAHLGIVAYSDACAADGNACVRSDAYTCDEEGGVMSSPTTWVGILGMMIMLIMLAYRNRSAFIVGIGFITFISWFRNTSITYFPDTPAGNDRFEYFKDIVRVEPLEKLLGNFTSDMNGVFVALITFLYVDFLDTSGTLLALAQDLGYVNETGDFPRSRFAFASDALATMIGSIFGLSPVTSYIESAAGVEAGARTGLTAVICGFYFFLSIFFAPIIASIPPWATGGALIIVGAIMCRALKDIKWYNLSHAVTAFLTVIITPLTYSIAYGLIAGIGCFVVLEGTFWLLSLVGIEKPVYLPHGESECEVSVEVKEDGPTVHTKAGMDESEAMPTKPGSDNDDLQPEIEA